MTEPYLIGIDPGIITGYAIWDGKKLCTVGSGKLHEILENVKFTAKNYTILVRLEDARKRKWFGKSGREQLQGAGSIKRDCCIWQDFLEDNKIPFDLVAPKNNKTKMNSNVFEKITGWKEQTNEHSHDAGILVYGYNCKNKLD